VYIQVGEVDVESPRKNSDLDREKKNRFGEVFEEDERNLEDEEEDELSFVANPSFQ
jgi:hypothetical protein